MLIVCGCRKYLWTAMWNIENDGGILSSNEKKKASISSEFLILATELHYEFKFHSNRPMLLRVHPFTFTLLGSITNLMACKMRLK